MPATFAMPGSFAREHEPTRLEFPTARPTFYMPPSASASSILSQSVRSPSRTSSPAKDSRKRPRGGVPDTPRPSRGNLPSTSSYSLDAPSPAPLVNTEYIFAGGTPSRDSYVVEDETPNVFEQDLRHGRFARPASQHTDSYFPRTPGLEHGGKRRRLATPTGGGWGRTMWQYTGGMAGKAINFCWTMAFNGFHAGDGQGYNMDFGTPIVVPGDPTNMSSTKDVFDDSYQGSSGTPLPGSFPDDQEYNAPRQWANEPLPTPTASDDWGRTSTLKSNWVMVDAPGMREAETSPARKRPRPSTASLYGRPPSRTAGTRPRMHTRNSASFASPRASLGGRAAINNERPQSSESDRPEHKRTRSSMASPRRESGNNTPKSPDVIKFEKKLNKQSQKQDDSMRRLNQQMQDMIREAQQALGSKVEIVDDAEDEGYAEGT